MSNVSGRAELLSGVFYLAAVLLYLDCVPKLGTVPRNAIYAVLVVLSVASKEQGITAPVSGFAWIIIVELCCYIVSNPDEMYKVAWRLHTFGENFAKRRRKMN